MLIPDLDDEKKDEMLHTGNSYMHFHCNIYLVAVAPKNNQRRVQSLAELDGYIKSSLPTGESSSGVALALLLSALSPIEALQEGDEVWDSDALLQDISQQMQEESMKLSTQNNNQDNNKANNISDNSTRRRGKTNEELFAKYSNNGEEIRAISFNDDDQIEGKYVFTFNNYIYFCTFLLIIDKNI